MILSILLTLLIPYLRSKLPTYYNKALAQARNQIRQDKQLQKTLQQLQKTHPLVVQILQALLQQEYEKDEKIQKK